MAGTLLFVHGTGVRKQGYEATLKLITDGAKRASLGLDVKGVNWGDAHGTKMDAPELAAILPPGTRALADHPTNEEIEAALWAHLVADPLFELRAAAVREPPPAAGVPLPGATAPGVEAAQRVSDFAQRVADPLPGGVTASRIADACNWLAQQRVLQTAATALNDPDGPDLNWAIARALVAYSLLQSRGEPGVGPEALFSGDVRDALVEAVVAQLAPASRGLFGWLFDELKGFVAGQATDYVKNHRTGIMGAASPGVGDILFYQRRGGDIAQMITDEIAHASKPVLAVGHSLGGIMLVDILSRENGPQVAKLVTVGSQSPALLQFDALENMRKNAHLVPTRANLLPFTPWLNIYDRNDFLSFCAERAFPGRSGIRDFEWASRAPFPDAHGAYWHSQPVYNEIAKFWAS